MRLLLGMILGSLLTIGGAYIADQQESSAEPQKVALLTADARQMWDKFTRQMTGPP